MDLAYKPGGILSLGSFQGEDAHFKLLGREHRALHGDRERVRRDNRPLAGPRIGFLATTYEIPASP